MNTEGAFIFNMMKRCNGENQVGCHFFFCLHPVLYQLLNFLHSGFNFRIEIFFVFLQETGFDMSCKLSPMETICMKFQILFSVLTCHANCL